MDKIRSIFKRWFVQSIIENILSKRFRWDILIPPLISMIIIWFGILEHIAFWGHILLPIFTIHALPTTVVIAIFALLNFWAIATILQYDFLFSPKNNNISYWMILHNNSTLNTHFGSFMVKLSIVMILFFCAVYLTGLFEVYLLWIIVPGLFNNNILSAFIAITITSLVGCFFKSMLIYILRKVSEV